MTNKRKLGTNSSSKFKLIGKKGGLNDKSATSIRRSEDEPSVEQKKAAPSQPPAIRLGSADSQNDLPVREYTSKVSDIMFKTMLKNSEHLTDQKLNSIMIS